MMLSFVLFAVSTCVIIFILLLLLFVFFFKQKTAYELLISDWSSDVCSSDLDEASDTGRGHQRDSNGTHPRYRHQHHGNGNEANDKLGDPMKDSHPSATAARAQIIGNADVAPQLHDVPQCADQAESHPADQRSKQNAHADRPLAAERDRKSVA